MPVFCLKCGYSITEPICASCIVKEIKIWLYEQSIKQNILNKIGNKLKFLLNNAKSLDYAVLPSKNPRHFSTIDCIKCGEEMHLMCLYCVTYQATRIMKENLKDENCFVSFRESFNLELYDYELNLDQNLLLEKDLWEEY
jgi:hypothetical protein